MGKKDMIKMKLTPEEATIIENIRALQSQVNKSDDQRREELMQKYMDMDSEAFMTEYRLCVGGDVITDVLADSLDNREKLHVIAEYIGDDVVYDLFYRYVPEDAQDEMFFNMHGQEELAEKMVDLVMDGDWE